MSRPADEQHPADDPLARHREELKRRFPLPAPVKKSRKPPVLLGLLIGAMALGLVWLDPSYRSERYGSAPGQVQNIALADGSSLTLDGGSQVNVSWHLRSRRVELLAGQALFDVAPATFRPFYTLAGSTEITVVGTRYNVSRVAEQVRVTVEEGKVAVRGQTNELLLTRGQQVLVHDGELGNPAQVDAEALSGWIGGRVVFDRTPLVEVLDTLRRQRNIVVHLDDPDLARLPVSGTFDSAKLDALLALLPKILPLELHTAADGSLSLSRRATKK
ncbi:FecR domain-containing protein [Metapseudomonas furukawaii]|uniref:FecR family protein n=1 Tax=Metapseudomonas furukawaii TaxID=1149133 RepID=UPI00227B55F1|nr:FecR domain-containing protein [Pseudomonas furukawaii]WAG81357.1 FecR domain-containing protein [Pseudomonas furukawaii]